MSLLLTLFTAACGVNVEGIHVCQNMKPSLLVAGNLTQRSDFPSAENKTARKSFLRLNLLQFRKDLFY